MGLSAGSFPSRWIAGSSRREALACDILQIHSDFFMTVYGYRKTYARLIVQGWDLGEVGRDQVMRTMRELVWRCKPFRDLADLELATFRWVSWRNSKQLHRSLGYGIPEEVETEYYANQTVQAVSL